LFTIQNTSTNQIHQPIRVSKSATENFRHFTDGDAYRTSSVKIRIISKKIRTYTEIFFQCTEIGLVSVYLRNTMPTEPVPYIYG